MVSLLVAEAADQTVLETLDPERLAAVILALVGLGLLGVLLVVVTMLAGRWARHDRPTRAERLAEAHRLRHETENGPQPSSTVEHRGETVIETPRSDETQTG